MEGRREGEEGRGEEGEEGEGGEEGGRERGSDIMKSWKTSISLFRSNYKFCSI